MNLGMHAFFLIRTTTVMIRCELKNSEVTKLVLKQKVYRKISPKSWNRLAM